MPGQFKVTAIGLTIRIVHLLLARAVAIRLVRDKAGDRIRAGRRTTLDAEAARANVAGIGIPESCVRLGGIDVEILTLAGQTRAGSIVIGNRTGDAIPRFLLGNDADSIVHRAPIVRTGEP